MKFWPVPDSFESIIPKAGTPGSFWEERSDRFNCGVDIYAPEHSVVLSIEDGMVIDIGVFSSPEDEIYWNRTYYVIIKTPGKINFKYCELQEVSVKIGQKLEAGTELGRIGKILNTQHISNGVPFYIRELAYMDHPSKLHLELYKAPIMEVRPYKVGNFMGDVKPKSILDPNVYLMGIKKHSHF